MLLDFGKPNIYTQETNKIIISISTYVIQEFQNIFDNFLDSADIKSFWLHLPVCNVASDGHFFTLRVFSIITIYWESSAEESIPNLWKKTFEFHKFWAFVNVFLLQFSVNFAN